MVSMSLMSAWEQFFLSLPCLEFKWTWGEVSFSLIGATLLWHKHTGSVGACETVYDCLDPPHPHHILADVVIFKRHLLLPTPVLNKTVKCVSLQYHASSTNTYVSGHLTGYNGSACIRQWYSDI